MDDRSQQEKEEAEMARLQRVISSPRGQSSPKIVIKKDVPTTANPTVVSPRSDGKIPAWKQQQLDKEKAEKDRIEEEKRKREQAAAEIVKRQLEHGIDADAGTTIRDDDSEYTSTPKVTHVEKDESSLKFDQRDEEERIKAEEERMMRATSGRY